MLNLRFQAVSGHAKPNLVRFSTHADTTLSETTIPTIRSTNSNLVPLVQLLHLVLISKNSYIHPDYFFNLISITNVKILAVFGHKIPKRRKFSAF